jgi:hypothetical protein
MKASYFTQEKADDDDIHLLMAKNQGYVPQSCLLNGQIVILLVGEGKDPCVGCQCDRLKCKGRIK